MVETKRKKFHDKDKYYRLAKEQGLRSRAAFKLTQINRKYNILENCNHAILDLCAAPGGWTQIAIKTCPKHVTIIAVDILPIRKFNNAPNVTTIIGDITTDKCKSDIQRALINNNNHNNKNNNNKNFVDLVLHDGAPNVGGEYSKDAYLQNEITIHAIKTTTQHLKYNGTFITKIYRSKDYNNIIWLLQQLFNDVSSYKPQASRQQSAEIFLICTNYKAPTKIDPKLLDPKYIFQSIDENTTGGTATATLSTTGMTILHKNWDKKTRKRQGYDMEHYDATMRHIENVSRFINSTFKDAINILSTSTGLSFQCELCNNVDNNKNKKKDDEEEEENDENKKKCYCNMILHHPFTTPNVTENCTDLQLLNKKDFKDLLTWRTKMQDAIAAIEEEESDKNKKDKDSDSSDSDDDDNISKGSEDEENEIQDEIAAMRKRRQREKKRKKKKERAIAAKRRRHAALGMDLNAIEIGEDDGKIFSLATITSKDTLNAVSEVNLDHITDEQLFGNNNDDDVIIGKDSDNENDNDDSDDERKRRMKRERDLDEAYSLYLQNTKSGNKMGTKLMKRTKKLAKQKVALQEAQEDQDMINNLSSYDAKTYAKLLTSKGGKDDDDSDDDDDDSDKNSDSDHDDGYFVDPLTPEEHAAMISEKRNEKNPLIHTFPEESKSIKTARWFSNPLFASIGQQTENENSNKNNKKDKNKNFDSDDDDDDGDNDDIGEVSSSEDESSDDEQPTKKKSNKKVKDDEVSSNDDEEGQTTKKKNKNKVDEEDADDKNKLSVDEILASMPKTDKQKRHEKRLKQMERDERKKARRAKKLGETENEFQIVPTATNADSGESDEEENVNHADKKLELMTPSQKKKVLEARELIKAGLGPVTDDDDDNKKGLEIVSQDQPLPIMDERKYDSDHEEYDSDDYAETLALGTMLIRGRSKEKAFVDASYNRYAWNDPADLPEWFIDDENKHYRPQLPIPPALLAKMKEKMLALSTKPIAKVAEARARKSKRARAKLAAAKKKAEAVANSTEMSEAMKLKAISKALRGQETRRPGKTYVVAKKGRANNKVGKGAKLVDKRMKSDKRALERIDKKRKKGKQNGLVGSKKRRHHK